MLVWMQPHGCLAPRDFSESLNNLTNVKITTVYRRRQNTTQNTLENKKKSLQQYKSGLFKFRKLKKGPFKGWFRIRFNIFWKQYGFRRNRKNQRASSGYHRYRELKKLLKKNPNRIGFYEGAGTFSYGLARPQWRCLMRETKSDYYQCRGVCYTKCDKKKDACWRQKIADETDCDNTGTIVKRKCKGKPKCKCKCDTSLKSYEPPKFCQVCLDSIRRKVTNYFYTSNSNDAGHTQFLPGHHDRY